MSATMWDAYDENNNPVQVPGVIVTCTTPECVNDGIGIEVPDDPNGYAVCGGCGNTLRTGTNIQPPPDVGVSS